MTLSQAIKNMIMTIKSILCILFGKSMAGGSPDPNDFPGMVYASPLGKNNDPPTGLHNTIRYTPTGLRNITRGNHPGIMDANQIFYPEWVT